MKTKYIQLYICLCLFFCFGCSKDESEIQIIEDEIEIIDAIEENEDDSDNDDDDDDNTPSETIKILSLGDSYTIGQSVCETCRFPEQLKDSLKLKVESNTNFELKVIATTGWTTSDLINAISTENLATDYDLVTLLIGVNNEFQGRPFSVYQTEFPQLINTAIEKANGDQNNIIVVSIPDYAFTPFGRGRESISTRLDTYNDFAENYCLENDISYVYITDITRQGLENTALVASDNLHPSELAYSKFVEKIRPVAFEKLND